MEEKTKQWYEEHPDLLNAEIAAMETITKDNHLNFRFLKDGRASWRIGFNSSLSGRKYIVDLVYSRKHPESKNIYTSIKVYPVEPTYEMLLDELNKSIGVDYKCMPYSVRDEEGKGYLSLCETEMAYKKIADCRKGNCIISAANVF